MKTLKIILPIIIILVIIAFGYSFIHIDGHEIKFVDELLEAKTVTVIVMNEENDDPKVEYDLNIEQIKNLKKLIEENTYTRRMSSTIVGVLPDKRYTIFANWDDNGQKHLQISLLGGEYIQILGEYGNNYNKIKNSNFEKELISILSDI
ncbi:MAG: hypothetical protein IKK18_04605 [Clostridia bacterium]|nr:hypothetical protein [Clostridia bacterium]